MDIISFSIKPADITNREEVRKLKAYAKAKGISLSYLILTAIAKKNKELKL